ncbi:MAG: flagellar export chaperone FliS [Methylococcaceae bacterium]|nr:flagellar export chaperone FliS [Methylococcaceae bacterium]
MSAKMNSALSSYSDYGYNSEIEYADPHRLIQMLFEGALKRIAFAKGAMQRKEIAEKGKFISQTIEIVGGLRASLDVENGGEIAANLESLYDYIGRRLVTANLKDSEEILDEISGLLRDVKIAWDAINSSSTEQVVADAPVAATENKTVKSDEDIPVKNPAPPVNARANRALKAYSG